MGGGLSDNYDNIAPQFACGYYKVYSATKKLTQEPVSLWQLDEELIKSRMKTKADRDRFIKNSLESIQQMRRLHHPHILKLEEVNEKTLSFSSEAVYNNLAGETALSTDEIAYIAQQLAEALLFLHKDAKLALLNLSPSTVCLTSSFEVKIVDFAFSSPIVQPDTPITPRVGVWKDSPFDPLLNFSAPEYVTTRQITQSVDVFSYGAIIASAFCKRQILDATTPNELYSISASVANQIPHSVFDEMRELLTACLKQNPRERPSFDAIVQSPAFLGLANRVLKYIDLILTKDPSDKFNFYKGLYQALPGFSPRLLKSKFLRLFITESLSDIRYSPVLVPLVFQIGTTFDKASFMDSIIKPLAPILTTINPPEVLLSVFSCVSILMDKVEKERHYEVIYPIFNAALSSQQPKLYAEAIKHMPEMLNSMDSSIIQSSVLPRITEFITASSDANVVASCVLCCQQTIAKIDNDFFAQNVVPKLLMASRRLNNGSVFGSMISIVETIHPSLNILLSTIVPFTSEILASNEVDPETQIRACNAINAAVERVKRERRLADRKTSTPTIRDDKKPVVKEEKPAAKDEDFWADTKEEAKEEIKAEEETPALFDGLNLSSPKKEGQRPSFKKKPPLKK